MAVTKALLKLSQIKRDIMGVKGSHVSNKHDDKEERGENEQSEQSVSLSSKQEGKGGCGDSNEKLDDPSLTYQMPLVYLLGRV